MAPSPWKNFRMSSSQVSFCNKMTGMTMRMGSQGAASGLVLSGDKAPCSMSQARNVST